MAKKDDTAFMFYGFISVIALLLGLFGRPFIDGGLANILLFGGAIGGSVNVLIKFFSDLKS